MRWLIGLLLIVFGATLVHRMGDPPLEPYDEASYADVALGVASGHWLDLQWMGGIPFLEKPPLYFWVTGVLFRLIGAGEMAARLFPAACGVALLVLVYEFARRSMGAYALLAPLVLLGVSQFWEYSGRAMLDVPVTLMVSLALAAFYVAQDTRGSYWLYGVALAAAIMTKSAVGLIPIAVSALFFLITSPRRLLDHRYLAGTLLGLGLALPWHIWMAAARGPLFLQEYVGYHVLDRFAGRIPINRGPLWFYLLYLLTEEPIFFITAAAAIAAALYLVIRRRDRLSAFLLLWAGFIFILFSVSQGKLAWYILPLYPPIAVLVAQVVKQIRMSAFLAAWIGFLLLVQVGLVVYRLQQDRATRSTFTYSGSQLRRLLSGLQTATQASEPISVLDDPEAVPLVGFYARRPVRLLFTREALGNVYRQMRTDYQGLGVVRFVSGTSAVIDMMDRESGVLITVKSNLPFMRGRVIAETEQFVALRYGPG